MLPKNQETSEQYVEKLLSQFKHTKSFSAPDWDDDFQKTYINSENNRPKGKILDAIQDHFYEQLKNFMQDLCKKNSSISIPELLLEFKAQIAKIKQDSERARRYVKRNIEEKVYEDDQDHGKVTGVKFYAAKKEIPETSFDRALKKFDELITREMAKQLVIEKMEGRDTQQDTLTKRFESFSSPNPDVQNKTTLDIQLFNQYRYHIDGVLSGTLSNQQKAIDVLLEEERTKLIAELEKLSLPEGVELIIKLPESMHLKKEGSIKDNSVHLKKSSNDENKISCLFSHVFNRQTEKMGLPPEVQKLKERVEAYNAVVDMKNRSDPQIRRDWTEPQAKTWIDSLNKIDKICDSISIANDNKEKLWGKNKTYRFKKFLSVCLQGLNKVFGKNTSNFFKPVRHDVYKPIDALVDNVDLIKKPRPKNK